MNNQGKQMYKLRAVLVIAILLVAGSGSFSQTKLIPYRKGTGWGYADTTGVLVIQPIYKSVSHYDRSNGHIVELNDKFGLLSQTGKKITGTTYDRLSFTFDPNCFITKVKGKQGLIDATGKALLPKTYDDVSDYPLQKEIRFQTGDMIGFYSPATKAIRYLEPVKEDEDEIVEMKAHDPGSDATRIDDKYFSFNSSGKVGVYRERLRLTFRDGRSIKKERSVDTVATLFDEVKLLNYYTAQAVLFRNARKWGVIYDNIISVPAKYDSISHAVITDRCEKFFVIVKESGKWGIIDVNGKEMIALDYDAIHFPVLFTENQARCFDLRKGVAVTKNGKQGVIDITGNVRVPIEQDIVELDANETYYIYHLGTRKGIHSARYSTGLIFDRQEKLDGFQEFYGRMYMRLVDDKKNFLGYVSSDGVRFFEQ